MLYCVLNKPNRTSSFDDIVESKFVLEEWDIKDLLKKIKEIDLAGIENVYNLLQKDIMRNISQVSLIEDKAAIEEWKLTIPIDDRNISDKLKSVCKTIQQARINKFCKDIAVGKIELSRFSERDVSAMKFRIFEVCQDELITYLDSRKSELMELNEINDLIERYTTRAETIIQDRSKDYSYPLRNSDILRKIVLALIDECYLSFDQEGIYDE
jgi:hypothetical protein